MGSYIYLITVSGTTPQVLIGYDLFGAFLKLLEDRPELNGRQVVKATLLQNNTTWYIQNECIPKEFTRTEIMKTKKKMGLEAMAFLSGDEHFVRQLLNRANGLAFIRKVRSTKTGDYMVRIHDDRSTIIAKSKPFEYEEDCEKLYDSILKQMGRIPSSEVIEDDFFGDIDDDFFGDDDEDELDFGDEDDDEELGLDDDFFDDDLDDDFFD